MTKFSSKGHGSGVFKKKCWKNGEFVVRTECVESKAIAGTANQKSEDGKMAEKEIGKVSHYFGHINVAGIEITKGKLKVGDKIHILGHTTDQILAVHSIQIEHDQVEKAKAGDSIGVTVDERVREHDTVYLVTGD